MSDAPAIMMSQTLIAQEQTVLSSYVEGAASAHSAPSSNPDKQELATGVVPHPGARARGDFVVGLDAQQPQRHIAAAHRRQNLLLTCRDELKDNATGIITMYTNVHAQRCAEMLLH